MTAPAEHLARLPEDQPHTCQSCGHVGADLVTRHGGWFCADLEACYQRRQNCPHCGARRPGHSLMCPDLPPNPYDNPDHMRGARNLVNTFGGSI